MDFSYLIFQIPLALVMLAGVVLAAINLTKHKSSAVLALIGFSMMLLRLVLYPVLIQMISSSGMHEPSMFRIVGGLSSLMSAFALGIVVAAVFVGREPDRPTPGPADAFSRDF